MTKLKLLINQIDTDKSVRVSFRAAEKADRELLLKDNLIREILFINPETAGKRTLIGPVEEIIDRLWSSILTTFNQEK